MKKQYGQSLDQINQVVVLYPWFTPALTEKARILVMAGDWEQALEVAQRVATQVYTLNVASRHNSIVL